MRGEFRVAVIIPAYQEERLLPETLRGIPQWVDEIIVIDDGSSDRTVDVATTFRIDRMSEMNVRAQGGDLSSNTRLHILRCPTNGGVGRAITLGYLTALELGADVGVVIGADAQMDPSEMASLVRPILSDFDYVKGERFTHPEVRQRMPKMRYWGNRALSLCTGLIIGDLSLKDAQCGYTALRLSALQKIQIESLYPRYGFPNDLLMRLALSKAKMTQVSVTPIYGTEQSKLSIPRVLLPLVGVLLRGVFRRLLRSPSSPASAHSIQRQRLKEYAIELLHQDHRQSLSAPHICGKDEGASSNVHSRELRHPTDHTELSEPPGQASEIASLSVS
jgi:dolichol-phosphate mannosyltransferase